MPSSLLVITRNLKIFSRRSKKRKLKTSITTTTTQNRITTFIMNLWANRLGQLAILAVALFFFSCEDDTSFLGYRNPNEKFKGKYVEIPLNSTVFLLDSIRTSNYFFNNEY